MRRTRLGRVSALAVGSALAGLVTAGPAAALDVGQKAPDFTLAAPGGKQVKLSDLTAKDPLVLDTFTRRSPAPERRRSWASGRPRPVRSPERPGRGRERRSTG